MHSVSLNPARNFRNSRLHTYWISEPYPHFNVMSLDVRRGLCTLLSVITQAELSQSIPDKWARWICTGCCLSTDSLMMTSLCQRSWLWTSCNKTIWDSFGNESYKQETERPFEEGGEHCRSLTNRRSDGGCEEHSEQRISLHDVEGVELGLDDVADERAGFHQRQVVRAGFEEDKYLAFA